MKFIVEAKDNNTRLDIFLSSVMKENPKYTNITRSFIANNISSIAIVNGEAAKKSYKIVKGDVIELKEGSLSEILNKMSGELVAQEGSLDIVYEDENYLVINKPHGLVVHPGDGNPDKTLANYILYYLSTQGSVDPLLERAGLVHRLDKGVGGLMVIAKNRKTQLHLKDQFEKHEVIKIYKATVTPFEKSKSQDGQIEGHSPQEVLEDLKKNNYIPTQEWMKVGGYIKRDSSNRKRMEFNPYGSGKYALSYLYQHNKSEFLIKIETGRMHQIRATLKFLGYSIDGDAMYGSKVGKEGSTISLTSIFLRFKKLNGEVLSLSLSNSL